MVSKTMKSVVTLSENIDLKLQDIAIPTPSKNQVLVKLISSTIHPSDHLSGMGYFVKRNYPHPMGTEGHGIVVEENEEDIKEQGSLKGKYVSFWSLFSSSWSEYSLVPRDELAVTREFKKEELGSASNFFLNPITSLGLLDSVIKGNHKGVFFNAGFSTVAKMLVVLLKEKGINSIPIVRKEEQIKPLIELGASAVLNSKDANFETNLKKAVSDFNVSVFLDSVGGKDACQVASSLPDNSSVFTYGGLSGEGFSQESTEVLAKRNVSVNGYFFFNYFKALNEEGKKNVIEKIQKELQTTFYTKISKTIKLEDLIPHYSEYQKDMSQGKVIVIF